MEDMCNKMRKKIHHIIIFILTMIMILTACGNSSDKDDDKEGDSSEFVSAQLMSIDDVIEYTEPLSIKGAEVLKNYLGDYLVNISEFYVEFDVSKLVQSTEKTEITMLFQYERFFENGVKDYESTVMRGSLNGTDLEIVAMPEDEIDELEEYYWHIVQAYNPDYLRLTEGRNDCWYIEQKTTVNYVYGDWDRVDYLNEDIVPKSQDFWLNEVETETEDNYEQYQVDYEWFNYYSCFYKTGTLEQLEIYLQNDIMLFVAAWGNNGEYAEWIFDVNSAELGKDNELIYSDESGTVLKYYYKDNYVRIETS